MTIAVIIATGRTGTGTEPAPTAALPCTVDATTVLTRLCDQLTTLNVPDRRVLTRPDLAPALRKDGHDVVECEDTAADLREIARLARGATGPVVLLPGDLVASGELLSRLLLDARAAPAAGLAPGLLRIGRARVEAFAELAERLAGELVEHAAATGGSAEGERAAGEMLRVGLAYSGLAVMRCGDDGMLCVRVDTEGAARAARAAADEVDEDGLRLDAAVEPGAAVKFDAAVEPGAAVKFDAALKPGAGPISARTVGPVAPALTRWAAGAGLTPNTVTAISMSVAVLAAVWFAAGTRTGMLAGAALLHLASVLGCLDGRLARYTPRASPLGAWLDAISGRAKEFVVYAGLAVGSSAAVPGTLVHSGDVWGPAVAAMCLPVVRHMIDTSGPAPPALALSGTPSARTAPATAAGAGASRARRLIALQATDRFALISVTAAVGNARLTFVALLLWGGAAAAFTLTERVMGAMDR